MFVERYMCVGTLCVWERYVCVGRLYICVLERFTYVCGNASLSLIILISAKN